MEDIAMSEEAVSSNVVSEDKSSEDTDSTSTYETTLFDTPLVQLDGELSTDSDEQDAESREDASSISIKAMGVQNQDNRK